MTAAYMTRCVYLTFFGEYRGSVAHELAEVHEAEVLAEGDELVEHHLAEEQDDYIPGFGRTRADDHGARAAREQRAHHRAAVDPVVLRGVRGLPQLPALREVREVVPARASRSSTVHAGEVQRRSSRSISVAIALAGIGVAYALLLARSSARSGSSERNPLARARQALPRHEVLPRRAVHRHHRRRRSRARSPTASTGSTSTSSTTC